MKRGIPSRTLGALLLSLAWCGAVFAFRLYRPLPVPPERAEIATLRAELDSLPADAAAQLRSWRESQPRGTDGTREILESLASEGWRVTDADDGIHLEIADPAAARWPGIIRAVERIEGAGGAGIRFLRIETSGSRTVRRFGRIEIGLRTENGSGPSEPRPHAARARRRTGFGAGRGRAAGDRSRDAFRRPSDSAGRNPRSRLRLPDRRRARPGHPRSRRRERLINPNPRMIW